MMQRARGAPSAAAPGLAAFGLVCIVAPALYVAFACAILFTPSRHFEWINDWLGGAIIWVILTTGGILYPATRGAIWALRLLRGFAVADIGFLAAAVIGNVFFYFELVKQQSGFAIFLFWFFLAPLMVAAAFLVDGLLHQPWFDPHATPEEIGPSRGTVGDFNRQAGVMSEGRLSPDKLAEALAAHPPPRWLCYAVPPVAAMRLRRWGPAAIFTPLCLAALALAPFLPVRAIFVYGLMGGFADRLRAIAMYRRIVALRQSAAAHEREPRSRRSARPLA